MRFVAAPANKSLSLADKVSEGVSQAPSPDGALAWDRSFQPRSFQPKLL
jgi:hypothetical protein